MDRRSVAVVGGGGVLRALLLCGAISTANAGPSAPEQPEPVLRLGEIVVTAGGAERDVLIRPTLESASLEIAASTVDSETMTRYDATVLTEALELAPGVFTETRGRKEKQLSSFRGQIYPYPDYSFNSVWQREFWELPSFLPAIAIDRVEILRSGGAIMVGPNSGLVGAINLVPRLFDEETSLFDFQAGSHETWRVSLLHGDRMENANYTVGLSSYSTAGPEGENAAESFESAFGTFWWVLDDRLSVELSAFGMVGERELRTAQSPGLLSLQNQTEEFSPMKSCGAVLRALYMHSPDVSTELSGGYIERRYDYTRIRSGEPEYTHDDDDWEYNLGLMHARALSEANVLRVGLQYNHWVSPDGKRYFVGNRMDVETFSAVVVDEHRWDKLVIDGGFRATRSYYHDYADTTFDITGQKLSGQSITDEWSEPTMTGTLGAKYCVNDGITLYAHAAVGQVDAPPGAVSEEDVDLDTENRTLLDAGVRLADERLGSVSAGLFGTSRDRAVVLDSTRVTDDGDTFNIYVNKDIRQYGLELEARSTRIANVLRLFCSVTITESEQDDDGHWREYREIPNQIGECGVLVDVGRFDLSIFGKYVGAYENKRFAEDGEYHPLGDFVDLNVTAGVMLNRERGTRVYVSLENVLDDEYSTVVGYPDYGFEAFAGIRSEF